MLSETELHGAGEAYLSVWVTSASSGFFASKSDWRHSCFARPFFCEIDLRTHAAARYSFWLSAIAALALVRLPSSACEAKRPNVDRRERASFQS